MWVNGGRRGPCERSEEGEVTEHCVNASRNAVNQRLAEQLEEEELVLWDFVSSCPCEELFGFG